MTDNFAKTCMIAAPPPPELRHPIRLQASGIDAMRKPMRALLVDIN